LLDFQLPRADQYSVAVDNELLYSVKNPSQNARAAWTLVNRGAPVGVHAIWDGSVAVIALSRKSLASTESGDDPDIDA
jgi:hypothetical protein